MHLSDNSSDVSSLACICQITHLCICQITHQMFPLWHARPGASGRGREAMALQIFSKLSDFQILSCFAGQFSDLLLVKIQVVYFIGKSLNLASPPPLCRCNDGSVPENSKELEEPPFSVPGRAGEENIARFQFIQELLS